MTVRILTGDVREQLRTLPDRSVQLVVTSPPYFGLRNYGTDPKVWGGDPEHAHAWDTVPSPGARTNDEKPGPLQHAGNKNRDRLSSDVCDCGAWRGELGMEPTPGLFIEHLVAIFDDIRRVLRDDGLVFCNLGDSYANDAKWGGSSGGKHVNALHGHPGIGRQKRSSGVVAKSLFLIPQRFAIAMQEAGWIVRQEIVWSKASAMPESVRDRMTSAWEPIWMFAKQGKYFYDAEAVKAQSISFSDSGGVVSSPDKAARVGQTTNGTGPTTLRHKATTANLRNVWTLGPEQSREAHFAQFPTEIPRRCILAGTRPGDTVLDPFLGSGTTAMVADRLGRDAIGIELNENYVKLAEERIKRDAGWLADVQTDEQPAAPAQAGLWEAS